MNKPLVSLCMPTNGVIDWVFPVLDSIYNQNVDIDLLGYNIFANGYWIGTVDANDTNFSIGINELPFTAKGSINISIEAFDQDGEVSTKRATVKV